MILTHIVNLGILPRDGKNIQFKEMGRLIRTTYNFSSSFCYFVPHYAAEKVVKKDYNNDTFNLDELDHHNGIEHDASLCRKFIILFKQIRQPTNSPLVHQAKIAPSVPIKASLMSNTSRNFLHTPQARTKMAILSSP